MLSIWIVHRLPHQRAALARIAGSADSTVLGGPDEKIFESASSPDVIVLGMSGDFEQELEFVHRSYRRHPTAAWIVLAESGDLDEARRLCDTLPASYLRFPPSPGALRAEIREALHRRRAAPLSRRRSRDVLARRFARWFADLELSDLMRAMDPRMARIPLLTLGEEGSGHGLLARYLHAYGGSPDDAFLHVACRDVFGLDDLLEQLDPTLGPSRSATYTIWLEDVDELPTALQRRLQDWIEYGLPAGTLRAAGVRWLASAHVDASDDWAPELDDAPQLHPGLALALSGLRVRIPPLRERTGMIEAFAADTALEWSTERGEPLRSFHPDAIEQLRHHPWPGNVRELEAVVLRTLSRTSADPILPEHLCFDDLEAESAFEPAAFGSAAFGSAAFRSGIESRLSETESRSSGMASRLSETESRSSGMASRLSEAESRLPEAEVLGEEIEDALADLEPEPLEAAPDDRGPVAGDAAEAIAPPPPPAESPQRIAVSAPAPTTADPRASDPDWPRLVRAVAHEIRNPLVSIRTFSEMLPDHFDDEDFRTRFSELVSHDVTRIGEVVGRLQGLAEMPEVKASNVDMAILLDGLLDEHRSEIQARRLLVLKELDRDQPLAYVDGAQIRGALNSLLSKALSLVPDQGDVYLASRHHAAGLDGQPMLRILLRYQHRPSTAGDGGGIVVEGMNLDETSLEVVMAEKVVHAHRGSLTINVSDGLESVIVIDLPAPSG